MVITLVDDIISCVLSIFTFTFRYYSIMSTLTRIVIKIVYMNHTLTVKHQK